MKRINFILDHLEKYKLKLLLLVLVTVIYAGMNLISSLMFSFVIDNVIDDKPIKMTIMKMLAGVLGGVENIREHLYILALVMILIYFMVMVLLRYRQSTQGVISENLVANIRNNLYHHLQELPYAYHVKAKTGELIQKCTSDVDMIRRFFAGQFAEIFYILATAIIAMTILFNINYKLAFFASLSLPVIFLYSFLFFRKIQKQFLVSDEAEAVMSTVIQESLSGIRVVKAFNREIYEIKKFEKTNREYYDVTYKMILSLGMYWASSYFICLLGILSIIVLGIFAVRNNAITVGDFVVFVTYQNMILYPIRALGRILSDFGKVTVSLDRIIDICETPGEDLIAGLKPDLRGDIVFRDVYFKYSDDNQDVLKGINLKIKKGESVALIGPTGSGKSSLVHLLSRLYDVDSGSIEINNCNINDINKNYLRDNVGIVLQEPFLYSKSIISNLKMVNPEASDDEIYESTRIACIHDVIKSFDKGYRTLVGERGVTLSGGQKQRLAIARTLIKKTPILIFDDSLSAVDTQTDNMIRNELNKIGKETTLIIITQRISSAKDCDRIFVIEDGIITESGTHDELIKIDGLYKRINEIQSQIIVKEELSNA
ncbi:MAG: ABC transporter ATP-binding protein [Erysipelotrichaceae bacterium]